MSNQLNINRNDLARIANNDPRIIRALELLLSSTTSNGGTLWTSIDFTASDIADIVTRPHSSLQSIGEADETSSSNVKDKHVSNIQLKTLYDSASDSDNRFTVISTSTAITAGTSQIILADASSGAITITLPAISASDKRRYVIKKIDATSNAVTIDADGAETIDGSLTLSISNLYDAVCIVPFGTGWFIV